MSDFIPNHKKLAVVAALATSLLLMSVVWSVSASARGQIVARFDTSRGHYEVLGYGLPVQEYARLLRERCGIGFLPVALCIVSTSLISYVESYNSVSMAAADRRFGRAIFKECAEDARKSWERTNARSRNSAR